MPNRTPLDALKAGIGLLTSSLPRDALVASAGYLRRHPRDLLQAARHAANLRLIVPLDALRWLVERIPGSKGPRDVTIMAAPPAIAVSLQHEVMGNPLRASAEITIDEIHASPEELRVALRIARLQIEPLGAKDGPLANLVRAMDLTRPGNLLGFLPRKPAVIVEASGDRVVLDLLQIPKLATSPVVRRLLEIATPVLTIPELRTEGDHLVVGLRPNASGLASALTALRR